MKALIVSYEEILNQKDEATFSLPREKFIEISEVFVICKMKYNKNFIKVICR